MQLQHCSVPRLFSYYLHTGTVLSRIFQHCLVDLYLLDSRVRGAKNNFDSYFADFVGKIESLFFNNSKFSILRVFWFGFREIAKLEDSAFEAEQFRAFKLFSNEGVVSI